MDDLDDPWLTGVMREAFSPLVAGDRWPLAAVAVAGERTGTWVSGAAVTSGFHIGSVTTTFTALLLATMAATGQIGLEDPVSRYLRAASGSKTRLVDLATHTAGYPRIPTNLKVRMVLRLRDPYSRVRDGDVDRALRRLTAPHAAPPYPFEYSNFGYGVLSRALAAAGGRPFGVLLRQEVLAPLELEDVALETDADPDGRRLFGHDGSGTEIEHWRNPALPGAGCLFSNIRGLRRYLVVNLNPETVALRPALELVHEARRPAGPGMEVALGWLVRATDEGPVHWHNGGTAGFGSFIGFDLRRRLGVAALISRRHDNDLDEAAMRAISELRAEGTSPAHDQPGP
ncbi:MAG: serine hydrolase domain-containing protein [Acidimicrobiales bacterium]